MEHDKEENEIVNNNLGSVKRVEKESSEQRQQSDWDILEDKDKLNDSSRKGGPHEKDSTLFY